MIPPINRIEWHRLITSKIDVLIQSYSLRLKLDNLRQKVKQNLITEKEAVNDLYNFCAENEDILVSDFENIFKDE